MDDDCPPPLTLPYMTNATRLFLRGDISWRSFRRVLAERPIAVSGRGYNFIVDEREWARTHGEGECSLIRSEGAELS